MVQRERIATMKDVQTKQGMEEFAEDISLVQERKEHDNNTNNILNVCTICASYLHTHQPVICSVYSLVFMFTPTRYHIQVSEDIYHSKDTLYVGGDVEV